MVKTGTDRWRNSKTACPTVNNKTASNSELDGTHCHKSPVPVVVKPVINSPPKVQERKNSDSKFIRKRGGTNCLPLEYIQIALIKETVRHALAPKEKSVNRIL